MKRLTGALLAVAALVLPAAAQAEEAPEIQPPPATIEDPLQGANRVMFGIDRKVNDILAGKGRILALARWVPAPVRAGLYNAFDNMEEPSTFANDILQKKPKQAARATGRFAINTTAGVLGIFDVAGRIGIKRAREDFGQTLATWGVTSGPYLFAPLAGPTSARDAVGGFVDSVFSPKHWLPMTDWERRGLDIVRFGVAPSTIGIRQIARGAAAAGDTDDEYATLRQLYADQRADQIADRPNLADNPVAAFPESKPKKN